MLLFLTIGNTTLIYSIMFPASVYEDYISRLRIYRGE